MIHKKTTFTSKSKTALASLLLAGTILTGGMSTAATAQDKVVVAVSPLGADSNLYWTTTGAFIFPSMQTLVGNSAETGKYDNSQLAESWEHNEDFTSWTFKLHPNAVFSDDWGPVTSADVVHSFEIHTGDDAKLSGISALKETTLTAIDDHTVRFDLPTPDPDFLFSHAGRGSLVIYSKAQFDAEGMEGYEAAPAGSGPFKYEGRDVGQSMTFSSIKDHWSGASPEFDEIEFRWVSEPSTRLAMLAAGEAHAVTLPRDLRDDAAEAGETVLSSSAGAMQSTMLFTGKFMKPEAEETRDATSYAWADARVREAVNRALDRDGILEVLYGEGVEALPVYTMDPRFPGYSQELADRFDEDYGYDPEKAMALLKEAGYPEAFDNAAIPLVVTSLAGNPEFAQMAELVQAYLDVVGIETEMREQDWATGNTAIRGFTADFVTPMRNAPVRPAALGVQIFFTEHASPHLDLGDPEINALGGELLTETDPEKRDAILNEMFTSIYESYAHIPMAAVPATVVVSSDLVEGWTFPGSTSSGLSHFELIDLK
ncbi:ABC-type transport system substrate-binding protein [Pacificibacter maritimus]|uniref:ABC-type transport system substrate-binding protein n=1 Tax=Pacificibacter maritimus TaxID=762213 RepID=A0A3N4UH20_9RHOB|nr:ABC transporter substrate-binding protein [Pacificibacter maritimus]RPE66551.1 ABC-type transport system substrate-binding protein [Pacificibacter maritimus]